VGEFEVQGMWWLPDHEDHKVPGVFSWDDDGGGSLRLVGQLRPVTLLDNELPDGRVQKYRDHSRDDDKIYPVVLGAVERQEFTLLSAFQTHWRDWSLEHAMETVHANAVLEGAWFGDPDVEADRARFRMRDLASWVNESGLDAASPRLDRTGEEFAVLTARSLPNLDIPYPGARVSLAQSLKTTRRGIEAIGVEQDWTLRIDRDEVAGLQSFVEVASDVQDLVSLATGRTAEFRAVVVQHPDLPQLSVGGTPMGGLRQNLIYHAQWANRADYEADGKDSRDPMDGRLMYFNLSHLGVDGLGRWLDAVAGFRTELGRAMATRYGRGYLEDRIMNVCAALESFDKHHRRTDDDVHYRARIEACVELAGEEFRSLVVEDPAAWSRKVKDLRHDLAHHRDRFRMDGSVGGHLVSEQLFWLFALCMLRVAQAPDAVFESIANHRQWGWLREQAEKGLAL
jgi:hypothetical protein